jgi:hypothetical protein
MKFTRLEKLILWILSSIFCSAIIVSGWIAYTVISQNSSLVDYIYPSTSKPIDISKLDEAILTNQAASIPITPGIFLPPTWTPSPPTPSITPTQLVPSNTPTETLNPTATFEYSSTPYFTPFPITTSTIAAKSQLFSGTGSANTPSFALPDGKVKITWNYSGIANEDYYIKLVEYNHEVYLGQLESWYKSTKSYYQTLLDEALRERDAIQVLWVQRELNSLKNEYNEKVKQENSRYKAEKKLYTSTFQLMIGTISSGTRKTLISKTGVSSGTITYIAKSASDYYLTIVTYGSWTVQVLP